MIPIFMKKELSKQRISDFSEYISSGIEEVGREHRMEVDVKQIIQLRRGKMPDSIFFLQNFSNILSKKQNYGSNTFRVLMHFFSLSTYGNYVCLDVRTISENMGITELSVKRATKKLTEDNIIIKTPNPHDKRRIDYFLNPMAAWKGNSMNRDKTLKKYKDDKIQLDMFIE